MTTEHNEQQPAFYANKWEIERGSADGVVAMRAGKCDQQRGFFTVPLYLEPRPHGSEALLREVCKALADVGCGACIGSMAPMEDLHGRIVAHLDRAQAGDAEVQP